MMRSSSTSSLYPNHHLWDDSVPIPKLLCFDDSRKRILLSFKSDSSSDPTLSVDNSIKSGSCNATPIDIESNCSEIDDNIDCNIIVKQMVKLVDPVSLTRFSLPCRGIYCMHLQCFDFHTYKLLNKGKVTCSFVCPLCNLVTPPGCVYVDSTIYCVNKLFQKHDDIEHIILHRDGKMEVVKAKYMYGCIDGIEVEYNGGVNSSSSGGSRQCLLKIASTWMHLDKIVPITFFQNMTIVTVESLAEATIDEVLILMNTITVKQLEDIMKTKKRQILDEILKKVPYYSNSYQGLKHDIISINGLGKSKSEKLIDELIDMVEVNKKKHLHDWCNCSLLVACDVAAGGTTISTDVFNSIHKDSKVLNAAVLLPPSDTTTITTNISSSSGSSNTTASISKGSSNAASTVTTPTSTISSSVSSRPLIAAHSATSMMMYGIPNVTTPTLNQRSLSLQGAGIAAAYAVASSKVATSANSGTLNRCTSVVKNQSTQTDIGICSNGSTDTVGDTTGSSTNRLCTSDADVIEGRIAATSPAIALSCITDNRSIGVKPTSNRKKRPIVDEELDSVDPVKSEHSRTASAPSKRVKLGEVCINLTEASASLLSCSVGVTCTTTTITAIAAAAVSTTTAAVSTATAGVSTTTAGVSTTTAGVNTTTTAGVNTTTTAGVSTTTAGVSTTTAAVSTTTAGVSATTAAVSSTAGTTTAGAATTTTTTTSTAGTTTAGSTTADTSVINSNMHAVDPACSPSRRASNASAAITTSSSVHGSEACDNADGHTNMNSNGIRTNGNASSSRGSYGHSSASNSSSYSHHLHANSKNASNSSSSSNYRHQQQTYHLCLQERPQLHIPQHPQHQQHQQHRPVQWDRQQQQQMHIPYHQQQQQQQRYPPNRQQQQQQQQQRHTEYRNKGSHKTNKYQANIAITDMIVSDFSL